MTVAQEPVDGYTAQALAMVTRIFADRSHPPRAMLFYLLRLTAKWRAEQQLLDPAIAPALRRFDIVVETHDGQTHDGQTQGGQTQGGQTHDDGSATILDLLVQRFRDSHDIVIVRERMRDIEFPPGYQPRDSIDRLISVWEYRSTPTPWLVMRARDFPA